MSNATDPEQIDHRPGVPILCHLGTARGTKLERFRESANVTNFVSDGNAIWEWRWAQSSVSSIGQACAPVVTLAA